MVVGSRVQSGSGRRLVTIVGCRPATVRIGGAAVRSCDAANTIATRVRRQLTHIGGRAGRFAANYLFLAKSYAKWLSLHPQRILR